MKFQVGDRVIKYHIISGSSYKAKKIPATVIETQKISQARWEKIKLKYEHNNRLISRWVPMDLVEVLK